MTFKDGTEMKRGCRISWSWPLAINLLKLSAQLTWQANYFFYPHSITEITESVVVKPGENAEFSCFVDANPIKADTIQWKREDFDMTRVVTTNISNIMYLTVKNVTDKDSGKFDCVANNGIGAEVKNSSFLLVKRRITFRECFVINLIIIHFLFKNSLDKPMIDESPGIAKSASDKGLTGVLTCRATGVPKVKFIWSREGSVIDPTTDDKYEAEENPVDMWVFWGDISYQLVFFAAHSISVWPSLMQILLVPWLSNHQDWHHRCRLKKNDRAYSRLALQVKKSSIQLQNHRRWEQPHSTVDWTDTRKERKIKLKDIGKTLREIGYQRCQWWW